MGLFGFGGPNLGKEILELFNEKPRETFYTNKQVLSLWNDVDKKVKSKIIDFAKKRKEIQTEAGLEKLGSGYARDFLYYSYIYLATGRWDQFKKCIELAASDPMQKGNEITYERNRKREWVLKYGEIADYLKKKDTPPLPVTQALIWAIPDIEKLGIIKKGGGTLWYEQDSLSPFGPNAPLHKSTFRKDCKEIGGMIMDTMSTKLLAEEKTLKQIAAYIMDDPIDAHDALTNAKMKVGEEAEAKTRLLLKQYLDIIDNDFAIGVKIIKEEEVVKIWQRRQEPDFDKISRQTNVRLVSIFLQFSYSLLAATVTRKSLGDSVPNFERCLEELSKRTQTTHGKGDANWWLRYKPLGYTVKGTDGIPIVPCGWPLRFMYDMSASNLEGYLDLRTLSIKLGYREEVREGVTKPKTGLKYENPILLTTEDTTFSQSRFKEWIPKIEKTAKKIA